MEIRGYKCAKYSIILIVFAPYGIVYKVIFFHFCQPKLSVQVSALTVFCFLLFLHFLVFLLEIEKRQNAALCGCSCVVKI